MEKLLGVSGRWSDSDKICGVETFKVLLEDAKNYSEDEIKVPKTVVIQEGANRCDVSRFLRPKENDSHGKPRLSIREDENFYFVRLLANIEDEVEELSSQLSNLSSGPSQPASQVEHLGEEAGEEVNGDNTTWLGIFPSENSNIQPCPVPTDGGLSSTLDDQFSYQLSAPDVDREDYKKKDNYVGPGGDRSDGPGGESGDNLGGYSGDKLGGDSGDGPDIRSNRSGGDVGCY